MHRVSREAMNGTLEWELELQCRHSNSQERVRQLIKLIIHGNEFTREDLAVPAMEQHAIGADRPRSSGYPGGSQDIAKFIADSMQFSVVSRTSHEELSMVGVLQSGPYLIQSRSITS